jgi:two-component system CitB family sensor kinase
VATEYEVRRTSKLSTRILVSQLTILIITMGVGFLLYVLQVRDTLDRQYEQRALTVAQSVAAIPEIRQAVAAGADTTGAVRRIADEIQRDTGATYVVVITRDGRRLSHPNPDLINQVIEEPLAVLDGNPQVGIDPGSLGRSANGKAAVRDDGGTVIGEISAGILENEVDNQLWRELPNLGVYTVLALGLGAIASVLLARRLKKTTFGLELSEIASLLQEREAMLHGVREGVITFTEDAHVTLINDEARRLLRLPPSTVGRRLDELAIPETLRQVLNGDLPGADQVVLTDDHCLLVNRMAVRLYGRELGAVVTLRDRTEVEGLLNELTSTRGLTDTLRAQQHEFANRMQTIAGLLELGEVDEAVGYLTDTSGAAEGFAESVSATISSPTIAALIVAKAAVAAERNVALQVAENTAVAELATDPVDVVTILGNLIDNAVDSVAGTPAANVTVYLRQFDHALHIRVSDTGSGVPTGHGQSIFTAGVTTKPARVDGGRGLGLAIVRRVVDRLGGQIAFTPGPAPAFTVSIPDNAAATAGARP